MIGGVAVPVVNATQMVQPGGATAVAVKPARKTKFNERLSLRRWSRAVWRDLERNREQMAMLRKWGMLGLVWLLMAIGPVPPIHAQVHGRLHATGLTCASPFRVAGTVLRVIDGDTLTLRLRTWVTTEQVETIRLLGVDTPELHGPDRARALAAKRYTEAWLAAAKGVRVSLCTRDSFGRLLAVVERDGDPLPLSDALIQAGHGTKRPP